MEQLIPAIPPNWTPLESAVPTALLSDFMHMGVLGTIQMYKHRDTREYLYVDADCTRFYDFSDDYGKEGKLVEISRSVALLRVFGAKACGFPLALLSLAPANFRAASLLTAFFEFQKELGWWGAYELNEADGIIRALSLIGENLAGFGCIITSELTESQCEKSLALESGRLRGTIATLQVPQSWLLPHGEDDSSSATEVCQWQAFCDRLAAEVGEAPFYGQPLSSVSAPSSCSVHAPAIDTAETAQQEAGLWRRFRRLFGL